MPGFPDPRSLLHNAVRILHRYLFFGDSNRILEDRPYHIFGTGWGREGANVSIDLFVFREEGEEVERNVGEAFHGIRLR